jgi:uncharacterized membrane protein YfcA
LSIPDVATWRLGLIAAYVVCGLVGAWGAVFTHSRFGLALFGVGAACMGVHVLLERKDRDREEAARASWIGEVRRVADDVGLEGSGIASLEALACYHDAAGRAAVLAALCALPAGQRSLRTAAQSVEPDAAWD